MRVLVSGYNCDPTGGSEAANTWYTALELARTGAKVHLLTRQADQLNVTAGLGLAEQEGIQIGVTFIRDDVPGSVNRGQLGVYLRYAAFQRRVARWATENRGWDVGHHVSWGSINHPVGLVGKVRPLVVGPAGGGQVLLPDLRRWVDGALPLDVIRSVVTRKAPGVNPWTRAIVAHSDLVLVANEESRRVVERLGVGRVRPMLPEGVRYLGRTPDQAEPEPNVVWIGRFLPIKAAGLAIEAFRETLSLCPEATLTFVGDGPTLGRVRSRAEDLVGVGKVRFTGQLPWREAQSVLGRAKVHLFTSVRDSFGAQTVEAATVGVPTVGLAIGGLMSLQDNPCFRLVDPHPIDSLAQRLGVAISSVLNSEPHAWLRSSADARCFAQTLTYERKAVELRAMYAQLVEG